METEDRQLRLLEAIARAVNVTPSAVTAHGPTVGYIYVTYRASKPRGRAWRMERNLLRPFVVRFWRRAAAAISLADWETHRGRRRGERTRTGRPPCEGTLNLELVRTRQMFGHAVTSNAIDRNPLAAARHVGRRRRRETVLTESQLATLIAGARYLRWDHQQLAFRAFVTVKGCCGMRMAEVLSIRRDRITDRGTYALREYETKTKRSRTVGFTVAALAALADVPAVEGNPRVFVNQHTGKPYAQGTIRKWLATVARATGLDLTVADGDFRLQARDLRASAASIADARGARPTQIQDMLGHSSLRTTEIYLRRNRDDNAIAVARIMEQRRPPRRAAPENCNEEEKEVVNPERVTLPS